MKDKQIKLITQSAEEADEAITLSEKLQPLFHGKDPAIVSAALADLVSIWLAGHRKDNREELLEEWIQCVRGLTGVSIAQMFGGKPPDGWEP